MYSRSLQKTTAQAVLTYHVSIPALRSVPVIMRACICGNVGWTKRTQRRNTVHRRALSDHHSGDVMGITFCRGYWCAGELYAEIILLVPSVFPGVWVRRLALQASDSGILFLYTVIRALPLVCELTYPIGLLSTSSPPRLRAPSYVLPFRAGHTSTLLRSSLSTPCSHMRTMLNTMNGS